MAPAPPLTNNHATRMHLIFEHAVEFVGLLSTAGIVLEASPSALRHAMVSAEMVIGKPFWQTPWWAHSADEQERLKSAIVRAGNGEFVRFETTHPASGGTLDPIDFSLTPIRDKSGCVVYILPEGRKINPLKAALTRVAENERRVREREDRYRIATEAGLTGVWDHDLKTGKMVIDTNLVNLLGFDEDEIIRWDAWKGLFHPEDVIRFMEHSRAYIKGRIPRFEVLGRVLNKHDQVRWILVRGKAERDASGWVQRMIGSATDITRLRQVEMELKKAKGDLEDRVDARTRELSYANKTLRAVVRDKVKTTRALRQREAELELKTAKLEDLNTALRFLLKKLDREKNAVEEKMMADLRDLVNPYLKKLVNRSREGEIRALATILDNNLKAIVSPFCRHLTSPAINLTPAELNIAHMVRAGGRTRQIANILNVSYKTVESHRVNIRKKLGLTRKGSNLRTCLMAIETPLSRIPEI